MRLISKTSFLQNQFCFFGLTPIEIIANTLNVYQMLTLQLYIYML